MTAPKSAVEEAKEALMRLVSCESALLAKQYEIGSPSVASLIDEARSALARLESMGEGEVWWRLKEDEGSTVFRTEADARRMEYDYGFTPERVRVYREPGE